MAYRRANESAGQRAACRADAGAFLTRGQRAAGASPREERSCQQQH
jgi:hypothetical protein